MKQWSVKLAGIAFAGLVLAACSTTPTKTEEGAQVEERGTPAGEVQEGGATTEGMQEGQFQGHPLDNPDSILAKRTIYFDFDKSDIKAEFRPIVEAHAQYLADHASASVTLEGHTDERGTREYNMALGERRANAVMQLMTLLGASGQQIRTVSYGEEQPVAMGHDEASWSRNRRVEIIYRSR